MNRIRVVVDAGCATITLARPDRRNALDREMADDLCAALGDLDADNSVRVVVLRGEGDDFCAGADLDALRNMLSAPQAAHEQDARALGDVFLQLRECRVPTIAVVKGRALAGGAALATACDIVIADDTAVFGYPEVLIGFVPAMAMALLVRATGERVALDLALTGRRVGAEEAARIGLATRVMEADELESALAELVGGIAASPPQALATTKALLYRLCEMDLRSGIAEGASVNARARMTEEFRAGVTRFTDRKRSS